MLDYYSLWQEINGDPLQQIGKKSGFNVPSGAIDCPVVQCIGVHGEVKWLGTGYPGSLFSGCETNSSCRNFSLAGGWKSLPIESGWGRYNFTQLSFDESARSLIKQVSIPNGSVVVNPDTLGPVDNPSFLPWPEEAPYLSPFFQPIGAPVPEVPAIPYWAVPYRGPDPSAPPDVVPPVGPKPDPAPEPTPEPISPANRQPGPTFVVGVGPQVQTSAPGLRKWPSPARGRVKERKAILNVSGTITKIANIVTESKDAVESIWKALPKWARSKPEKGHRKVTMQQMLADLYKHWQEVDLPLAVANLVANQVQDYVYGKASKLAARGVSRAADGGYYVGGVGPNTGGRYRPHYDGSAGQAAQFPDYGKYLPKFSAGQAAKWAGF